MRILFVCLGNICRSPLAHGVFEHVADEMGLKVVVDSAGTGGWHVGNPPDPRSVHVAADHGIDVTGQRARRFVVEDFSRFDLILGMDESNVATIGAMAADETAATVGLFMRHVLGRTDNVPDPYYGGDDGFEACYRMIRAGAEALGTRLASGIDKPPRS
ncbi:MAG: low molecular weight protein-tyrosine-phosphatase [Pseudomonadota bacterium]